MEWLNHLANDMRAAKEFSAKVRSLPRQQPLSESLGEAVAELKHVYETIESRIIEEEIDEAKRFMAEASEKIQSMKAEIKIAKNAC
eukprot:7023315-Alexandrium_andersonii.AAC.1